LKILVYITLKSSVLDPQGKAIEKTLLDLGFSGVEEVRQGKYIELEIQENDSQKAKNQAEEMCQKLLANTVIENYRIDLGS